jgi:hypothetical protein
MTRAQKIACTLAALTLITAAAIGIAAANTHTIGIATPASHGLNLPLPDDAEPAAEPEPTVNSWPSAAELQVDLRVVDKQCFGDIGCHVTVEPELTYLGTLDTATFGTYSVTVAITGDESGEIITTLNVTGADYTVMPVFLSTVSSTVVPAATVTSVQ